jgi:gliding motility-associated-like protein
MMIHFSPSYNRLINYTFLSVLSVTCFLCLTSCRHKNTTTTLTSVNTLVCNKSNVIFTAKVNPVTATGTVTFFDGSIQLGTAPIVGGTATYSISTLAPGSHAITAVYSGNSIFNKSTSKVVTQIVNAIDPGSVDKGAVNPGPGCAPLNPGTTVSIADASGQGVITYSWEQSTDNQASWQTAAGSSATSYKTFDPDSMNSTTLLRRVATSTLNGLACSDYSNILSYTVLPFPIFTAIGPLCTNSIAPALPLTSTNGITGTWTPAAINTAIAGTTTYTFTPAGNSCATTITMDVIISDPITPAFKAIAPICQNSTAPVLTATSDNGISGTWNPAAINTLTAGTTVYTFTPAAWKCAPTVTLSVTVDPQPIPTFTAIADICINSLAPALPLSSNNGIKGSWSPAVISTNTPGTTTYTFTPDTGKCKATAKLDITIVNLVTPIFTGVGTLCTNSIAPALTLTSTNGITGTWTPGIINTALAGTTSYTFTPDGNSCATTTTIDIIISEQITPAFTAIAPICQNSTAPILPATSNNGISGTWNPAAINTSTAGTTVYTFTPASGHCAPAVTLSVTVDPQPIPTFTAIAGICQNSVAPALPLSSNNGIRGSWSPAVISTGTPGTTTYTFTPDTGKCKTPASIDITVSSPVTPVFAPIGPLLQNSAAPLLPASSSNTPAIMGTWKPTSVNTSIPGNSIYTFTPDAGQCAVTAMLDITILMKIKAVIAEGEIIPGAEGILTGACRQVKLNASKSVGENLKYEWSLPDQGGALSNLTGPGTEFQLSPAFTGSLPADFRVRLLVTDKDGNTDSDTVRIKVDRPVVARITSSGKLEKDGSMIVDALITSGNVLNYKWYTPGGKIIGPDNLTTARLFGAGIYTLETTDLYGCKTTTDFKFPVELDQIIANPDYIRTSWAKDTTINVLQNDQSTVNLVPGTVRIITPPAKGSTKVNSNGSIIYIPGERRPGRDQFEYEVCDVLNLCASAKVTIDIFDSEIIIPEGFSPNGDGVNDLFVFSGLENYRKSQLYVYTRAGQPVYQSVDYLNDWDGTTVQSTLTGMQLVPVGVYYYILKLGGTDRSLKGFVYIGY